MSGPGNSQQPALPRRQSARPLTFSWVQAPRWVFPFICFRLACIVANALPEIVELLTLRLTVSHSNQLSYGSN